MKIVNIVAIAKMKKPFNLDELLNKLDNTGRTVNWVKIRLKPENYYIALYGSGKFLMTGIKDIKTLKSVSKRVITLLSEAGIDNSLEKIDIVNFVATDEIKLKSTLQDIIVTLNTSSAYYEPEQFHGLSYRDDDGVFYTLFTSGKIIITGFKDLQLAENNLKKFKKLLN